MNTDLYRLSWVSWAVRSQEDDEPCAFASIESAADYLERLGVPSDEIDIALAEMAFRGHTRSQFGTNG